MFKYYLTINGRIINNVGRTKKEVARWLQVHSSKIEWKTKNQFVFKHIDSVIYEWIFRVNKH